MSAGQRARARAAREAQRSKERDKAARSRERRARLAAVTPARPQRRARPRRYGAMPLRQRLVLAVGWFAVQLLGWQLLPGAGQRLGLALLSLLALPLVVTLYFSPRSSR